jgi:2-oxoisovalerate dehydrogenase E2 component (dihydrolipoyl transacylase)
MSETKVFLLPDLGEGLTEAELVNWLVAVGDEIRVDQPIAEVETAKSVVEVPSPYAGTVAELHGEPGQTLDVGKPLISVTPLVEPAETKSPVVELVETPVESKAAETAAAETYRTEEKAGSGNVLIGYGTPGGTATVRRTRPRRASAVSTGSTSGAPTVDLVETPRNEMKDQSAKLTSSADDLLLQRTRVPGKLGAVISPLVRRMAKEHGVDLGHMQGSGESGLIMRRDVEAAITKPAGNLSEPSPRRLSLSKQACRQGLDKLDQRCHRPPHRPWNHQPHPRPGCPEGSRGQHGAEPLRDPRGNGLGGRRCDRPR